jgi:hypothetical protein
VAYEIVKPNIERVKILLTNGVYLVVVLDLYRTGLVLEKKPGLKIWSVKSEKRQVRVPQIEGLLYLIKHHVTKMYGGNGSTSLDGCERSASYRCSYPWEKGVYWTAGWATLTEPVWLL